MAKLKMIPRPFYCPESSMVAHLTKVFEGEYDVPIFGSGLTIIDIGANFGAFSVWASHKWPGSYIYAYEPHPKTYETLSKNAGNYPFITIYNKGIGKPGLRPLYNGKNNSGEASLYQNAESDMTGQHVWIDDPLTLPEADIIKIDAEGVEPEILLRLIEDGRSFKAIMFEWHHMEHRQMIDTALKDYNLVKCHVTGNPHLGTACYIHKSVTMEIP